MFGRGKKPTASRNARQTSIEETGGRMLRKDFKCGRVKWRVVPYSDEWQAFIQGRKSVYRLVVRGSGPYAGAIYTPMGESRKGTVVMEYSIGIGVSSQWSTPEDAAKAVFERFSEGDGYVKNITAEDYYAHC